MRIDIASCREPIPTARTSYVLACALISACMQQAIQIVCTPAMPRRSGTSDVTSGTYSVVMWWRNWLTVSRIATSRRCHSIDTCRSSLHSTLQLRLNGSVTLLPILQSPSTYAYGLGSRHLLQKEQFSLHLHCVIPPGAARVCE